MPTAVRGADCSTRRCVPLGAAFRESPEERITNEARRKSYEQVLRAHFLVPLLPLRASAGACFNECAACVHPTRKLADVRVSYPRQACCISPSCAGPPSGNGRGPTRIAARQAALNRIELGVDGGVGNVAIGLGAQARCHTDPIAATRSVVTEPASAPQ